MTEHTERSEWSRERQSFSCTDEVWAAAKQAWAEQLEEHPAWTDWVETALAEASARTAEEFGSLRTAPARIPPGRRDGSAPGPQRRRRSFTCQPHIWSAARNAWWTEVSHYPQLSDWIEAALAAKAGLASPPQKETHHET